MLLSCMTAMQIRLYHFLSSRATVLRLLLGFMVGLSSIGTSANQIGMNQSSWASCYSCNNAYGACTAVQGGSPYDQFSTFRNVSLAKVLASGGSNCSWISNTVMTFGSTQYPVQQIACDYPAGLLNVTLVLNASAFGFIPTAPTLSLVGEGMFAWTPGSLTGMQSLGNSRMRTLHAALIQSANASSTAMSCNVCT